MKTGNSIAPLPKNQGRACRLLRDLLLPFSMNTSPPSIVVLWDESHLWGMLLLRALNASGLDFEILSARDVARGALKSPARQLLLVPGGWARLKGTALGGRGREAVRAFLHQGGTYLGFCGGAGLALTAGETG